MYCLLCHEKIPRMRRLKKLEFCCDEHMEQHKQETLKRLLEYGEPHQFPPADDPIHRLEVLTSGHTETTPEKPVPVWQLQPFAGIDLRRYAPTWAPASALLAPQLISPRGSFAFSAASLTAGDSKLVRRPRARSLPILPGQMLVGRSPEFPSRFRPQLRLVCPGLVASSGASLAAAQPAGLRTVTATSGWAPVGIPLAAGSIDLHAREADLRSAPPLLVYNLPDGFESVPFATPRREAVTFRRLASPLRDDNAQPSRPAQAALGPNPPGASLHFPCSPAARKLEDSPRTRQDHEILEPAADFRLVELPLALPAPAALRWFRAARPLVSARQVTAPAWIATAVEPFGAAGPLAPDLEARLTTPLWSEIRAVAPESPLHSRCEHRARPPGGALELAGPLAVHLGEQRTAQPVSGIRLAAPNLMIWRQPVPEPLDPQGIGELTGPLEVSLGAWRLATPATGVRLAAPNSMIWRQPMPEQLALHGAGPRVALAALPLQTVMPAVAPAHLVGPLAGLEASRKTPAKADQGAGSLGGRPTTALHPPMFVPMQVAVWVDATLPFEIQLTAPNLSIHRQPVPESVRPRSLVELAGPLELNVGAWRIATPPSEVLPMPPHRHLRGHGALQAARPRCVMEAAALLGVSTPVRSIGPLPREIRLAPASSTIVLRHELKPAQPPANLRSAGLVIEPCSARESAAEPWRGAPEPRPPRELLRCDGTPVEPAHLGRARPVAELTAEQIAAQPDAIPQIIPCGSWAPDSALLLPGGAPSQAPAAAPSVPAGWLSTVLSVDSGDPSTRIENQPVATPPPGVAYLPVRSEAPLSLCALEPVPVEELVAVKAMAANLPAGSAFATPDAVAPQASVAVGQPPACQPVREAIPETSAAPLILSWPAAYDPPPSIRAPFDPAIYAPPAQDRPSLPRPSARRPSETFQTRFILLEPSPDAGRTTPVGATAAPGRPRRWMFMEDSQQLSPLDVMAYQVPAKAPPPIHEDDGVRKTLEQSQRPSRHRRWLTLAAIAWHEIVLPALVTRRAKKWMGAGLALTSAYLVLYSSFSPLHPVFESWCRSLDERSYFLLEENLQVRQEVWSNSAALEGRQDGWIALKNGLSLYRPSSNRADYEFAFEGLIPHGAVLGWVVRAADEKNYYAFKLTRQSRGKEKRSALLRATVVGGAMPAPEKAFPLPFELEDNKVYRVRVHAIGDRVTTMIDDRGINSFSDSAHRLGGVGFLGDGGDNGLIRSMSISGNDDTSGRAIYWIKGLSVFVQKPRAAGNQPAAGGH